jgi:3',5'-cyclic AMP phosphodiesterase CpdA
MTEYYLLKKSILDYKLKINRRIEIIQEILLKMGNNEKGIIWILNRDYTKIILNIKEKKYREDLFNALEFEVDTILLNLIHRFMKTIDDIFKEPKKEVNWEQIPFQNLFYFDFLPPQDEEFLFSTFVNYHHWVFQFGKVSKEEFLKLFRFKLKYVEDSLE